MKRFLFAPALAVAALVVAGCATPTSTASTTASAPTLDGADVRVLEFPGVAVDGTVPGDGKPREVRVVIDEPAMKIVTIVLRAGTLLPPHMSAVPVTISALQGSGTVIAGEERLRIDASHAVALRPGVQHAVEPDAGTDIVLLVTHFGRADGKGQ